MGEYVPILVLTIILLGCDCAKECEKCTSSNERSSCRYGTTSLIDRDIKCPPGKSTCFQMSYTVKCNGNIVYKRGCDDENFCNVQRAREDIDLRQCKQCNEEYCNVASKIQCYKCDSEDMGSSCRTGSIDNELVSCKSGSVCYRYSAVTIQTDIYSRGCGTYDTCDSLGQKYGNALHSCKLCEDDYCNNEEIPITF